MDKETAVEVMKAADAIEMMLESIPHGIACNIIGKLGEIRNAADCSFPGGFAGECIYCETLMGHDEAVRCGDEQCCQECWKKRVDEMQSCEHDLSDDTDEHGDPGKHCSKCGYFEPTEHAGGL